MWKTFVLDFVLRTHLTLHFLPNVSKKSMNEAETCFLVDILVSVHKKNQLIVTLLENPCYCILDSANWHTQLIGTLPILVALIQLISTCQLSARVL